MFENKPFIQPIKVTTYDFILKKKNFLWTLEVLRRYWVVSVIEEKIYRLNKVRFRDRKSYILKTSKVKKYCWNKEENK